jgi:hypothetical protein
MISSFDKVGIRVKAGASRGQQYYLPWLRQCGGSVNCTLQRIHVHNSFQFPGRFSQVTADKFCGLAKEHRHPDPPVNARRRVCPG